MNYKNITGYRFELTDPVVVNLTGSCDKTVEHSFFRLAAGADGKPATLTVNAGYAWDGTSGPTVQTRGNRLAGLVHDALYQCIREGLLDASYKDFADRQLEYLIRTYKAGTKWDMALAPWRWIRGRYYYWGVRLFGNASIRRKAEGEGNETVLRA